MRIRFEDDNLRRLYEETDFTMPRFGSDVAKAFRKKVNLLVSADSELDLRNLKSLHYEKLKGDRAGLRSIRLNLKWRLILRVDSDELGRQVLILEIVDYH